MTKDSITILFWNVKNIPAPGYIAGLAQRYSIDIILLAESPYWATPDKLLDKVNQAVGTGSSGASAGLFVENSQVREKHHRVQVFSRFGPYYWLLLKQRKYYSIWRFLTRSRNSIILAASHFPGPQFDEGDGQRLIAGLLRNDLEEIEPYYTNNAENEAYTVVIGDLNASPFDAGISGVYGLFGLPSRSLARKGGRTIAGEYHTCFYNPTWRFLGLADDVEDEHGDYLIKPGKPLGKLPCVPGSYFYESYSKSVWHGWYVLDQVLVRPSLLTYFDDNDVFIPRSNGIQPLVKRGEHRPDKSISDHLPLIITIKR